MPPWKAFTICFLRTLLNKKGDTVTGRVYEFSENFGTFVAVDDKYSARIPGFENTTTLKIGDIIEANVTNRKPDGKLDLTIRAKAYIQMNADAEEVLRIIDEYGGVLPFNDKASPDIIKREAHMSKKCFQTCCRPSLQRTPDRIHGQRHSPDIISILRRLDFQNDYFRTNEPNIL